MNTAAFRKNILERLNTLLKPRHFKRNQNIFSYSNKDLTYYICVQYTVDSTNEILKATINIEIASSKLSYLDDFGIPGYLHRHFIKNISDYAPHRSDKWWVIQDEVSAETAQKEIEELILHKVLPELNSLKSTNDLVSLWKKDIYPGLTSYQGKEYLSLLTAS